MMVRLISQTFRSIKPPNNNNLKPPKSEPSSTSSSSPLSDRSRSKLSWSVYLILSTNKPIKTYVGVTTNFSRRSFNKTTYLATTNISFFYSTAATKNASSSSLRDHILGYEGLGRAIKCINLGEYGQESFLSHQIGIAIENATLFVQAQEKVGQKSTNNTMY